ARCGELETVNDFLNDLHWPQPARADACAKDLRQAIIVNEEYMHWLKFSKTPGARINLGRSRGFDELSFHVNDEIHRYPIDIPFLSQSLKALPHAPDGAIVNADCSDLILYRFFRSAS